MTMKIPAIKNPNINSVANTVCLVSKVVMMPSLCVMKKIIVSAKKTSQAIAVTAANCGSITIATAMTAETPSKAKVTLSANRVFNFVLENAAFICLSASPLVDHRDALDVLVLTTWFSSAVSDITVHFLSDNRGSENSIRLIHQIYVSESWNWNTGHRSGHFRDVLSLSKQVKASAEPLFVTS